MLENHLFRYTSNTHFYQLFVQLNSFSHQARAALVYDAVTLLAETFNRMLKKKPDTFKTFIRGGGKGETNSSRTLNCSRNAVWEHGDRIAKNARKVTDKNLTIQTHLIIIFPMKQLSDLEGLTGALRFGEDGRRENFSLSVVEMTINSDIVKVKS